MPGVSTEPSTVGIRATWTCALCGVQSRTYQIVFLPPALDGLDRPAGWQDAGRWSVCGSHTLTEAGEKRAD